MKLVTFSLLYTGKSVQADDNQFIINYQDSEDFSESLENPISQYSNGSESEQLFRQAMDILSQFPNNRFNYTKDIGSDYDIRLIDFLPNIPIKSIIKKVSSFLKLGSLIINDEEDEEYETVPIKLDDRLLKAQNLLEKGSELNNLNCLFLLAEINIYGNYTYPTNYSNSLKYYKRLTQLSHNSTALYMLGFMYSTGMFGEIEQNQRKASFYYQLAAESGNIKALMAVGYRYLTGIATEEDSSLALHYYSLAARKAFEYVIGGPPGGRHLSYYSIRIADANGGIWGNGAGEMRNTVVPAQEMYEEQTEMSTDLQDDLIEYFYYKRGMLSYAGGPIKKRNYKLSFANTNKCMNLWDEKTAKLKKSDNLIVDEDLYYFTATRCASLRGLLFLRGEGTEQNFIEAKKLFELSIENQHKDLKLDAVALNGLGTIYEYGLGVEINTTKALEFYSTAVHNIEVRSTSYLTQISQEQRNAAFKNEAKLLFQTGNVKEALESVRPAALAGNAEALYMLAEMSENEFDGQMSSTYLVSLYKQFVEKVEPVSSSLEWAFDQFIFGTTELALIGYSMAAEQGYETGLSSSAYLLYPRGGMLLPKPNATEERKKMALTYLIRSSRYNVDSAVMVGDFYFYGIGTKQDYEKAAAYYMKAQERQSLMAKWNMGWMHEHGLGVEQDFHLAKRFYDSAGNRAYVSSLPTKLSLLRLYYKIVYNKIIGNKIGSSLNEEDKKPIRTWNDYGKLISDLLGSSNSNQNDLNNQSEKPQIPYQKKTNDDDDDEVVVDDFTMVVFIVLILIIFFVLRLRVQMQLRRRRRQEEQNRNRNQNDNENDNQLQPPIEPNFQFNVQFAFIPI